MAARWRCSSAVLRRVPSARSAARIARAPGGAGHSPCSTTRTLLAYDRIARRRGRKRALLALAHRLLVVVYHVLNNGCTYTEFGAHYLDRRRHEAHTRYFLRRLRELGYEATLRPLDAPPPVAA